MINLSAQQTNYVDFKQADVFLEVNADSSYVKGYVGYVFDITKPINYLTIDAKNITIFGLAVNRKKIEFDYNGKQIILKTDFVISNDNTLMIYYKTKPNKALYFIKRKDNYNIWTQGQGKYTSNWLPSFDDVNEKVIFNLSIDFSQDFTVLSNGNLVDKKNNAKGNEEYST